MSMLEYLAGVKTCKSHGDNDRRLLINRFFLEDDDEGVGFQGDETTF